MVSPSWIWFRHSVPLPVTRAPTPVSSATTTEMKKYGRDGGSAVGPGCQSSSLSSTVSGKTRGAGRKPTQRPTPATCLPDVSDGAVSVASPRMGSAPHTIIGGGGKSSASGVAVAVCEEEATSATFADTSSRSQASTGPDCSTGGAG